MTSSNSPFDNRAHFFEEHFNRALPYQEYLATGTPAQRERWLSFDTQCSLTEAQTLLLRDFNRKLNVLVLSGIWCGDCMRQGPMFTKIATASKTIDLRFIDNNENPALRDELRIAGGARVPVIVALSEDFYEVGRSGDRTLSHYQQKALRELGPACDSGIGIVDANELNLELAEWLDFLERMQLILRLSPFLRTRHND